MADDRIFPMFKICFYNKTEGLFEAKETPIPVFLHKKTCQGQSEMFY